MSEKIEYPWVTFKLREENYCITSQFIETMTTADRFHPLPDMDSSLRGVLDLNGRMLPVADMRSLLGLESFDQELEIFRSMKRAHLNWVDALHKSVMDGVPFTLAADPHLCTFGKWYYSFEPDNYELRLVLKEIKEPHSSLHHCVERIRRARDCEEAVSILEEAEDICRKRIVPLLDQLIDTFQRTNRSVTIVLEKEGKIMGALVDQVTSIQNFQDRDCKYSRKSGNCPYVKQLVTNADGTVFFEIDIDTLMSL